MKTRGENPFEEVFSPKAPAKPVPALSQNFSERPAANGR